MLSLRARHPWSTTERPDLLSMQIKDMVHNLETMYQHLDISLDPVVYILARDKYSSVILTSNWTNSLTDIDLWTANSRAQVIEWRIKFQISKAGQPRSIILLIIAHYDENVNYMAQAIYLNVRGTGRTNALIDTQSSIDDVLAAAFEVLVDEWYTWHEDDYTGGEVDA